MSNKKIFIANKDYEDIIKQGDRVELLSALGKNFEVLNLRTDKYIKLSVSIFLKIFK